MKFISIIKVKAVNPETAEVIEGFRAVCDNGRELKVLNTLDELKAAGKPSEVLSKLVVINGQYGDYCQLRKYEVLATVTEW